jgi:PAS domain S-box-containing protein
VIGEQSKELRADSLQDPLEAMNAIRGRICNGYLFALSVVIVAATIASISRIFDIGWQPVMPFHVGLTVSCWTVTLFRHKLSYRFRAAFVISVFLALGLGGMFSFGLIGAGLVALLLCCVLTAVFFGTRATMVMLAISVAIVIVSGSGIVFGYVKLGFDNNAYATSLYAWITAVLVLLICGGPTVVGVTLSKDVATDLISRLHEQSTELKEQEEHLEESVEKKTQELIREIADRKNIERTLRQNEQRLQMALDAAEAGTFFFDAAADIVTWDKRSLEIFGIKPEDFHGTHDDWADRVHPDDLPVVEPIVLRAIESEAEQALDVEYRIQRPNGEPRHVHAQAWLLRDAEGRFEGVSGLHFDITKQKAAEEELRLARESAEAASRAKSEFLSSMSHELRTPMNAILGFGQMLDFNPREPLTEAQKVCVDHIMKGGQHLLDLINEILDLARIEAGKVELAIEDISPVGIFDECLPLITSMAERRGIDVSVSDAAAEMPRVRADHTRFKQVLLNLISNAVKYNRENGTVSIGVEETADAMLRVSVTDTGEGIPEDKRDELFKPFNRLGAETSEIEGTGIGLVVCKRLVELMNGGVGLQSEVGKGSTFWIELPLAERGRRKTAETGDAVEARTKGLLPDMTGMVLYVEDNPDNLELMKLIVSRIEGLSMISAHTGELGVELARAEKPDVIILDINLPGMNGIETLEQLRRHENTRNIPVLALSAAATGKDIERGMKAGFLSYLTKPIQVPNAMEAIKSALEMA